eukprot:4834377-Pyramimonas_sp.AAC.1
MRLSNKTLETLQNLFSHPLPRCRACSDACEFDSLSDLPTNDADSKTVVTACDDSYVNMYSVEHASLIGSLPGHASWVLSVAWNPDGSGFVTGSSDRTVKVWDTTSRTCAQTHTQHTDSVWGVAFKPDGAFDHALSSYLVTAVPVNILEPWVTNSQKQ